MPFFTSYFVIFFLVFLMYFSIERQYTFYNFCICFVSVNYMMPFLLNFSLVFTRYQLVSYLSLPPKIAHFLIIQFIKQSFYILVLFYQDQLLGGPEQGLVWTPRPNLVFFTPISITSHLGADQCPFNAMLHPSPSYCYCIILHVDGRG